MRKDELNEMYVPSSRATPQRVPVEEDLRPSLPVDSTANVMTRRPHFRQVQLAPAGDHLEPSSNHQHMRIKFHTDEPKGEPTIPSHPVKGVLELHEKITRQIGSLESVLMAGLQTIRKDLACLGGSQLPAKSLNAGHAPAPRLSPTVFSVPESEISLPTHRGESSDIYRLSGEKSALTQKSTHRNTDCFVLRDSSITSDTVLRNRFKSQSLPGGILTWDPGAFSFCDSTFIKETVRRSRLLKEPYDVKVLYHESGFFQRIAKHSLFEYVTMAVIVGNAFWIAWSTDKEGEGATEVDAWSIMPDVPFFMYFLLELLIRFMAFRNKLGCCRDKWFLFDSCLAALYFFDPFALNFIGIVSGSKKSTALTNVMRLCRLTRLFRLNRLLRFFPQLMVLVKGMLTATASVNYTIMLLALFTFVFAISIRIVVPSGSRIQEMYFPTVPETMHHLLIHGNFMDSFAVFILKIKAESVPCLILAWIYVVVSALLSMNMLIGILVEVVGSVATEEHESRLIDGAKLQFNDMLYEFDDNKDGSLSWQDFQNMVQSSDCRHALRYMGVDLRAMIDAAEDIYLDADGVDANEMTYAEFLNVLLDSRGGAAAQVKDVLAISSRLNRKFNDLKQRLEIIVAKVDGVANVSRRMWTSFDPQEEANSSVPRLRVAKTFDKSSPND